LAEREAIISKWQGQDAADAWLEEVEGEKALSWVKDQNDVCFGTLGNPKDSPLYSEALTILDSKEKIPHVTKIGDFYYNFWTDETNPRGLFRRTTLLKYKSKNPTWDVVLDVDALGKAEGESWVWKGYVLYKGEPGNSAEDPSVLCRALVRLSRGGADANVVREFDLLSKTFVDGGFSLPEAKSSCSWKDLNTLLIGTDFDGDGASLTDSGYVFCSICSSYLPSFLLSFLPFLVPCLSLSLSLSLFLSLSRSITSCLPAFIL
jgi:prolyl oligopeptidase